MGEAVGMPLARERKETIALHTHFLSNQILMMRPVEAGQ